VSQLDTEYANAGDEADVATRDYLPEEIRRLIMEELSVNPVVAGRAFGLGVSSAYRAVRSGAIPSKRIGAKFAVPTSWIRQELGLDQAPQAKPAPQPAQKKQEVVKSSKKKRRRGR
jgi:hypothetical protein